MIKILILTFILLTPLVSDARIFNFKRQSFATYLRGSFGTNRLQKYAFEPGFPTTVSFPDSNGVNQTYSGEFGLMFTSAITVRLGVEALYPQLVNQLEGRNAGGTNLMSVTSQVYAIVPQLNLEVPFKETKGFRFFLSLGAGYAYVTVKNTVSMTSTGSSTFSGVQDYIEEGTGTGLMYQGSLGIEFALFDNVSFSFEPGYRALKVTEISANRDATTVSGTVTKGSALTNVDGSKRTVDLGGPFAAATLRIYIR